MALEPTITAKSGFNLRVYVSDPDVSPSVFEVIGGLRSPSITINNNPVDITNVASNGFREFLPDGGIQDFQLSASGVFDSKTNGARILWTASVNRQLAELRLESGHGDSFQGLFVISSLTRSGQYSDAETYNISLNGSGQIIYTPY